MRTNLLFLATILALVALADASTTMLASAKSFLASLRAEQRAKVSLPFGGDERSNWHFVPRSRKGIPLKELQPDQRKRFEGLLKTGLSTEGYAKVNGILELEGVLREIEGPFRDPGLYFVSVFGTPSDAEPWGWRFEGHHLSLNYTVVGGQGIATAPAFFGANPAAHKGLRPLAAEEDLARALLRSLDAAQRRKAVFEDVAPRDIVTGAREKVSPLEPAGIEAKELTEAQRRGLDTLLQTYLDRMAPDLAADRRRKLQEAGLERIRFAWAGGAEPGQPHYYRLQGPTFLVEYDNTQDGANHIHTVWRDFEGDFGEDLLQRHYRETPHTR